MPTLRGHARGRLRVGTGRIAPQSRRETQRSRRERNGKGKEEPGGGLLFRSKVLSAPPLRFSAALAVTCLYAADLIPPRAVRGDAGWHTLLPLPRLHRRQSVRRFDISFPPPLETGTM